MATLNANALTTLARAKEELDITDEDTDFDDQIINYINTASDELELLCNRTFRQQSYVHRLSGNGKPFIAFREFPVTVLTEVLVDKGWLFAANSDVPVPTQADVDEQVFLVRRGLCNDWPLDQPMAIKVTYTAGYGDGVDPATLPDGIQQACIEYVRFLYLSQGDRRIGRTAKNKLGESASWDANGLPFIIEALYSPYKRDAVIMRALAKLGVSQGVKDGGDTANK